MRRQWFLVLLMGLPGLAWAACYGCAADGYAVTGGDSTSNTAGAGELAGATGSPESLGGATGAEWRPESGGESAASGATGLAGRSAAGGELYVAGGEPGVAGSVGQGGLGGGNPSLGGASSSNGGGSEAGGNGGAVSDAGATGLGGGTSVGGASAVGGDVGFGGVGTTGGTDGTGGDVGFGGVPTTGGTEGTGGDGGLGGTPAAGGTTAEAGGAASAGEGGTGSVASTCSDGELSGTETDIDCGGNCAPAQRCEAGESCVSANDCASVICSAGSCVAASVKVQQAGCAVEGCATNDPEFHVYLKMVNLGARAIDLAGIELKYYFVDETGTATVIECYYASVALETVTRSIVPLEIPMEHADTAVVYGFTSGSVAGGGSVTIECGVRTSDWGTLDDTNDYSFSLSGTYVDDTTVTASIDGTLLWGIAP